MEEYLPARNGEYWRFACCLAKTSICILTVEPLARDCSNCQSHVSRRDLRSKLTLERRRLLQGDWQSQKRPVQWEADREATHVIIQRTTLDQVLPENKPILQGCSPFPGNRQSRNRSAHQEVTREATYIYIRSKKLHQSRKMTFVEQIETVTASHGQKLLLL